MAGSESSLEPSVQWSVQSSVESSVESRTVADGEDRVRDQAAMWCDLFLAHVDAESAHIAVTRRAELYVRVAGLPLEKVYDALNTDADGWANRLTELRQHERANLAAAEKSAAGGAR